MNRIFRNCRAAAIAAIVGIILIPDASIALAQSTTLPLSCVPASLSVAQRSDGNLSVTCTVATSSSSGCSIAVVGTSLPSTGGTVSVTANNCGTGLVWANVVNPNTVPSTNSGVSFTDTIGANTLTTPKIYAAYTVTGSAAPSPIAAPVQVTVAAASSGGGGGTTSCGVTPKVISWPTSQYVPVGSVSGSTPLVVQFTIPAGTAPNAAVRLVQFSSPDFAAFTSVLSTSACSFGSDASIGSLATVSQTQAATYPYNIGGPAPFGGISVLTPGVPYYLNIENAGGGSKSHPISVSITGG